MPQWLNLTLPWLIVSAMLAFFLAIARYLTPDRWWTLNGRVSANVTHLVLALGLAGINTLSLLWRDRHQLWPGPTTDKADTIT